MVVLLLLCRRSLVADWLIDPSVGRQQHKLYGYVMPVLDNVKAIITPSSSRSYADRPHACVYRVDVRSVYACSCR